MPGNFMINAEMKPDVLDWGRLGWLSNPSTTGAKQLTVIAGDVFPDKGHAFHRHPNQEEVLLVLAGKVEQWIEREMRILGPGDSAFIPAGIVHGTFNTGAEDAKVVAILGPCVGDAGIEQVDMSGEAPWNALRK